VLNQKKKISTQRYFKEIQENKIYSLNLKGKALFLVKKENQIFVGNLNCPHAGAKLSLGRLSDKNEIVCPLHNYKFDLLSGKNSDGHALCLKMYETVVEFGEVFVVDR